ncbi:MAG: heme-binding domain-containing protein [Flavisolibacter sp.]
MFKKILIGILIVFLVSQFFRPSLNNGSASTATDITHVVPVPDSVMSILKTACYDCHSDHTNYPWYSKITPVNWWLDNHIVEGKGHLNFSRFTTYSYKRKAKKLEEVAEMVEKHEMPLESYLWIHKEAKLNEAQRKMLIDWGKISEGLVMSDSLANVKL